MEKRVTFRSPWLPYVLVAPQIVITLVFFIWPATQALRQSMLIEDAFGMSSQFVWFENYAALLDDEHYLGSFKKTALFSVWKTAQLACAIAFCLHTSDATARLLLRASLVYLPSLLILLMALPLF